MPDEPEFNRNLLVSFTKVIKPIVTSFDHNNIDNIYRFGKQAGQRPVLIKFKSQLANKDLFQNADLLKEKNLFLAEDRPREERIERGLLRRCLLTLKKANVKAVIKKGEIIVNDVPMNAEQVKREYPHLFREREKTSGEGNLRTGKAASESVQGNLGSQMAGPQRTQPRYTTENGGATSSPLHSPRHSGNVILEQAGTEEEREAALPQYLNLEMSPVITPRTKRKRGEHAHVKIDEYFRPPSFQASQSTSEEKVTKID